MSFGTIVIIVIGIFFLWGAILGVRRQKKWKKTIADQFSKAGLVNSPNAREYVEKSIATLFHSEAKIIDLNNTVCIR